MGTGPINDPPPSGPGRGLMDEHDVAAYLNVSVSTFRKMRARRDCPRITKVGGSLRWDFPDVQAWIDSKKEKAPTVKPGLSVVPGGRAA